MNRTTRCAVCYAALLILTIALGVCGICFGSVKISAHEIAAAVFGGEKSTASDIILISRLPRVIAAIVLGGALAVSGYLLQTFFANPVAGPFVLGISSGANFLGSVIAGNRLGSDAVITTVFADANKKYLSTDYSSTFTPAEGSISSEIKLLGYKAMR